MNHRRREPCDSKSYYESSKSPKALVFYLINTPFPNSQGCKHVLAEDFPRLFQVNRYYQVNYNWFNEPFAVSLYKVLILRHAWLNLWDKHMTTGRINQIAITDLFYEETLGGNRVLPLHPPPAITIKVMQWYIKYHRDKMSIHIALFDFL